METATTDQSLIDTAAETTAIDLSLKNKEDTAMKTVTTDQSLNETMSSKDMKCDLCNVMGLSITQMDAHLNSKSHLNVCAEKKSWLCPICDSDSISGEAAIMSHLCGKPHARKVKAELQLVHFKCEECSKDVCGEENFKQHKQKCHSAKAADRSRVQQQQQQLASGANAYFNCDECGKSVCGANNLTLHKNSHEKKRKRQQKRLLQLENTLGRETAVETTADSVSSAAPFTSVKVEVNKRYTCVFWKKRDAYREWLETAHESRPC